MWILYCINNFYYCGQGRADDRQKNKVVVSVSHTCIKAETWIQTHACSIKTGDSWASLCAAVLKQSPALSHTLSHTLTSHCRWGGMFRIWIFRLLQRWERERERGERGGGGRDRTVLTDLKGSQMTERRLICAYLRRQIQQLRVKGVSMMGAKSCTGVIFTLCSGHGSFNTRQSQIRQKRSPEWSNGEELQ